MRTIRSIVAFSLVAFTAGCQRETVAEPLALNVGLNAVAMPCSFTNSGTTMTLNGDCTTSASILVPNGFTLDGNGYTITGVDPAGDHFRGAVVRNGDAVAHIRNLSVTVSGLADVCDAGGDRLRGIMLDAASGSIIGNTVNNVRQVGSGCQEGNSIDVRNFSQPTTFTVEVANNTVTNWMKTGIVANGRVSVNMRNNTIGASANQAVLAANSIQIGFGAQGVVKANRVSGNQWCTDATAFATGILVFGVDEFTRAPLTLDLTITQNVFTGNADVGIYTFGNGILVNNNKVFDDGNIADCNLSLDDYGIYNDINEAKTSGANTFTNNKIGGFDTPFFGGTIGSNKINPNK